ncbi:MAG: D-alanyl-D-alanine carboxypeptidase [Ruminiclostridium sp.]|nr:D-alanyl-D-alanine carboxypeptidase [Ruminiclostridium sp.]
MSISLADEVDDEPFTGVLSDDFLQVSGVPAIDAAAAVVIDVKTGRVLYSKNATVRRSIASTTKIMTAIVAIENGRLDDTVEINSRAASIWGSNINLQPGQKYTLNELLYGLLLNSGNDASIAIAEHISGSVESFVEKMNQKARELGAYNTSYANTHGLDAPGHYSTAYDLARIAKYALENPVFAKIVGTKYAAIPGIQLHNTNELLELYQGAYGVKTGYTGKAGRCLVASAERDGMRLISVVLGSPTNYKRALSSKNILDYAFINYKYHVMVEEGQEIARLPVYRGRDGFVAIKASETVEIPLRDDEYEKLEMKVFVPEGFEAPVYAGSDTGYVEYALDGETVGRTTLKIWRNIARKTVGDYLKGIINDWAEMMREGIFR